MIAASVSRRQVTIPSAMITCTMHQESILRTLPARSQIDSPLKEEKKEGTKSLFSEGRINCFNEQKNTWSHTVEIKNNEQSQTRTSYEDVEAAGPLDDIDSLNDYRSKIRPATHHNTRNDLLVSAHNPLQPIATLPSSFTPE